MSIKNIKIKNSYLELSSEFYNLETPSPLINPHLIDVNSTLVKELGLDTLDKKEWIDLVNGATLFSSTKPFSMVYAGHQFGHFVPRLGDGRAINIGTINGYHLQLKGSGVTKYSRSGDGRAVLRSSIREYLTSEHMHALGIESTRAVAIIGAKHRVLDKIGRVVLLFLEPLRVGLDLGHLSILLIRVCLKRCKA